MTGMLPSRTEVADVAGLVAGAATAAVLNFAYVVYVGRSLQPGEYADFGAALSVVFVVTLIIGPVAPSLSRVAATMVIRGEGSRVRSLRASALKWSGICLIPMIAAGLAVSPLFSRSFHFRSATTLMAAFSASAFYLLLTAERGLLQGLRRFAAHNVSTVMEALTRFAAAVVLIAFFRTATAALVAYLLSIITAEVLIAGNWRDRHADQEPAPLADVFRFAAPMFGLMIGAAAFQNADLLAAKRWLSPPSAGAYAAASALTRTIGVLFVPLYILAGPTIASHQERGESIRWATLRMVAYFVGLTAVPIILFACFPKIIVTLLFGDQYAEAALILGPLAGAMVIGYSGLLIAQTLVVSRRFLVVPCYLVLAAIQIGSFVVNHTSAMAIIREMYAVQGIALVTVLALFLMTERGDKQHAEPIP